QDGAVETGLDSGPELRRQVKPWLVEDVGRAYDAALGDGEAGRALTGLEHDALHRAGVLPEESDGVERAGLGLVTEHERSMALEQLHDAASDQVGDALDVERAGDVAAHARERLGHVAPAPG